MTLLNIFNSGGLWAFPFITLGVFGYQMYKAYKVSKGGSLERKDEFSKWEPSGKNVPIYKTAEFPWALCWLLATILLFSWLIVDYKGV